MCCLFLIDTAKVWLTFDFNILKKFLVSTRALLLRLVDIDDLGGTDLGDLVQALEAALEHLADRDGAGQGLPGGLDGASGMMS